MSTFDEAQKRAARRRSPWNLVLFATLICSFALLFGLGLLAVDRLHRFAHPEQSLADAKGLAVVVATSSVLFAAIPVSLLIANALARKVAPLRRTLDAEARGHPGTDYRSSQRALRKLALIAVPVFIGLAILCSLLPWGR